MRFYIYIYLIIFIFIPEKVFSANNPVVINEFMSSNHNTIKDEDGDYEDWIELYNRDSVAHSLLGYHLSDDLDIPFRWAFPDVEIEAGGFLLIFASGKDKTEGNELHTNFSISMTGEPLLLTAPGGVEADFIEAVEVQTDLSYGRIPDGGEKFHFFSMTTPGSTNMEGKKYFTPEAELVFSKSGGFYTEPFNLQIESTPVQAVVRYTLDGSVPDLGNSYVLDEFIPLHNSTSLTENPIIYINTTSPNGPPRFIWKEPKTPGFKANVIRARAFKGDTAISEVVTHTYFIDENISERFNLPVFSINLPEEALFDADTGIYIAGNAYNDNPHGPLWGWGGGNFHNRGIEWERHANIEFFETDFNQVTNQEIGIRIHGGGTRSLPLKSLRLYPRNLYGKNTLEHQFFRDDTLTTFRRLILRNSGQDFIKTMFTDALSHEMLSDIDMENQAYRPAVVFINGAYWGILNIRERMDKHYIAARKGVDPEKIDMLELNNSIVEGDYEHYVFLLDYLRNNIIYTQQQMEIVESMMDVDNYIDYMIAKLYMGVYDWPGNNIRYWRESNTGGVWRWLNYDNDDAFADASFNSLLHATATDGDSWPNPPWSTELFRLLLESPVFEKRFIDRFAYHLKYTFSPDVLSEKAFEMYYEIENEMYHHINRWRHPANYSKWQDNVKQILHFIDERPCIMREYIIDFFELENDYLFEICIKQKESGSIQIYPNPGNGNFQVLVEQPKVSFGDVTVLNALGQRVHTQRNLFSGGKTIFNLHLPDHLSAGTYFLQINIRDTSLKSRILLF